MEMIAVIFIIAVLVSVSVPALNSVTNVHLKNATYLFAGNVKYLYDQAILERQYVRLVIDVDKGVYWAEMTKDPVYLTRKPLDVESGAVVIEEEEDEEEIERLKQMVLFQPEEDYQWGGWAEFAEKFAKRKPTFSQYVTDLSRQTRLPESVAIYKVQTESVSEDVTKGQVFIHIFPNGYVEKSSVQFVRKSHLEDFDRFPSEYDIFTVQVEPLTGRATIFNEAVEMPEDRFDEENSW